MGHSSKEQRAEKPDPVTDTQKRKCVSIEANISSIRQIFTISYLCLQNKNTTLVIQNEHPSTREGPHGWLKGHCEGECAIYLSPYLYPLFWVPKNGLEHLSCSNTESKQLLQPTLRQTRLSHGLLCLVCHWYQSQLVQSHCESLCDTADTSWHNFHSKNSGCPVT